MIDKLKKKLRIDFDKNTKLGFYLRGIALLLTPKFIYKNDFQKEYDNLSEEEKEYINKRVNYYNKLEEDFVLDKTCITIKEFIKTEKKKTYFFDLLEYLKYFDYKKKISYLFGDITHVPEKPSFVKSRPIGKDNQNSILMKLNKVRHFIFVDDPYSFEEKKDMLVWRGGVGVDARKLFMNNYFKHPLCNIGQTNKRKSDHDYWKKEKMSIHEQLEYKFLISIEGNDVASNLKWAMSSNSLVFMKKPIYETWFMEGQLKANYHYVLLEDDFSDLEEKMNYYMKNIDEAKFIIKNANGYVKQFKNKKRETLISYLVIKKFFEKSLQQEKR